ncbi:hypothetical protein [Halonotius roseus]|uniref:hypothetical protein n=1 Tax=Halonotius roseus TaxID=2511997 RepID=UPI001FE33CDB|nr:hypothetical protein [Halonotius roseus]
MTTPAVLAGLAGCTSSGFSNSDQPTEYTLSIDTIDASPTEHALYKPSDDPLFGDPARTALAAIIPDGTHRTYGFTPLPEDSYVAGEGRYFQIDSAVTGRQEMDRTLVHVESIDDDAVDSDAIHVDSLDRPSARVIKILHSNSATRGAGSTADLLRDDAYVLRRPAERDSRLASGDLDGRVITMTEDGGFPYRVSVTTESIRETGYTTRAIPVADSEAGFREIVFATEIDAELDDESLSTAARDLLDRALGGEHTESTPLSTEYEAVLAALGVADADDSLNGRLLWYADQLYRYGLYIDHPD